MSFKSFMLGTKSVPIIEYIGEETRNANYRSYMPKYLYKPPFGYPRSSNIDYLRYLSGLPYIEMAIDTIIRKVCASKWNIIPNPRIPKKILDKEFYKDDDFKDNVEFEMQHIRAFLENPNSNPHETFNDVFVEKVIRDLVTLNTAVINKVYNNKMEMVEVIARDGGSFTINPNVFGLLTDREDIISSKKIVKAPEDVSNYLIEMPSAVARDRGAFFQYGWLSGPMPIPFGKKEIIWLQDKKYSYDIYGKSVVENIAEAVQLLIYQIESDLEYYTNNNVPKGIIGLDASDSSEIKNFKQQWEESQYTKDEFGNRKKAMNKVPILNYIPKFERIEFSSSEMETLEKQKWYAKIVWANFGVTETELGYTGDANGLSNQIIQTKVFKDKAINPKLRMIEEAINNQIIPEFGYFLEYGEGKNKLKIPKYVFKYEDFDIDTEKQKSDLFKNWIETGYKTINEIRLSEGLSAVDYGDKPPMNYRDMEQPEDGAEEFGSELLGEDEGKNEGMEPQQNQTEDINDVNNNKEEKALGPDGVMNLKEFEVMDEKEILDVFKRELRELEKIVLRKVKLEVKNFERIKDLFKLDKLKIFFFGYIRKMFSKGLMKAEDKINKYKVFNAIANERQLEFLKNYSFDLIKDMNDSIAEDVGKVLSMSLINGETLDNRIKRLKEVFDVTEARLEAIVRTETTRAIEIGEQDGYKQSGLEVKKWILMKDDDRTSDISRALHEKYGSADKAIPIDENFYVVYKQGKKVKTIDQAIGPFHINERCNIMYEVI